MNSHNLVRRELHPKATVPVDQSGPVIDFRSSDETLDRYQERIAVSGWRLENYRKNPVVQNAHSYCSLSDTIGKSLITEIRGTPDSSGPERGLQSAAPSLSLGERAGVRAEFPIVDLAGSPQHSQANTARTSSSPLPLGEGQGEGAYLFQRILFAVEENPMAKVAYGLYKGGFLNAVSVGFIPLSWENGSKEAGYRRKFLEQELLEVSAVSIPANPNALTLAMKAGAVEMGDLKELVQLLKHFCTEKADRIPDTSALGSAIDEARSAPRPSDGRGIKGEGLLQLTQQLNEIRAILRRA